MGTCHLTTIQAFACFLLLLITQLCAFPHRAGPSSEAISSEHLMGTGTEATGGSLRNSQRIQNGDEVATLVRTAYENGELLNADSWNNSNQRGSRKGIQRDTTRYQDTHTSTTSLKTRTDSTEIQQGQRRLFGNENGSSMSDLMQSDGKIVFPTDDEMIGKPHKFDPRPAPVCQGLTFCERAAYYPEDLVNQAMQLNDSLKFLAGVDVVSEIEQRIDVMDDVPLCVSTEQVVYPKSAENKRKEWLFVVNQDNFKQGIRIETCSNENGECSVIDGLAEGYRTTCKQKYIYRQLAAVSNDGKVSSDMFRFPSSCCCHVKFTGNPLTRIGLLGQQRSQTPIPKSRRRK